MLVPKESDRDVDVRVRAEGRVAAVGALSAPARGEGRRLVGVAAEDRHEAALLNKENTEKRAAYFSFPYN